MSDPVDVEPSSTSAIAVNDIPRAEKWSASVLDVVVDGKPVLHHLVELAAEHKVFHKGRGSKADLFEKASGVANEKILSKVVFKMRVGKKDEFRLPAKLTAEQLARIVLSEMDRYNAQDQEEARESGTEGSHSNKRCD